MEKEHKIFENIQDAKVLDKGILKPLFKSHGGKCGCKHPDMTLDHPYIQYLKDNQRR